MKSYRILKKWMIVRVITSMNKWIAEFELEDGDTMPEHMDLEYKGARIDFHCRPLEYERTTKNDLGVERDLISSITEKISEKVTENHEEFIFETIRPYCENVVQMKVSKRDLEQALLRYYGKNECKAEDCISRKNILESLNGAFPSTDWNKALFRKIILDSPSVYPKRETVTEFADRCRECGTHFIPISVLENIKAECIRAVDKIPITFSKNDADDCLKRDIREIFDKYISGSEKE